MNESYAYEWLGAVVSSGYPDAYIELIGGGALSVTIPLNKSGSKSALMDVMGLGIYSEENDGEAIDFYSFEDLADDMPEWKKAGLALEWMSEQL